MCLSRPGRETAVKHCCLSSNIWTVAEELGPSTAPPPRLMSPVGLSRAILGFPLPWRHHSRAGTARASWRLGSFCMVLLLGENSLTRAAQERASLGSQFQKRYSASRLGHGSQSPRPACHTASWIQEPREKGNKANL